jgi:uncharacterized cupredoxin-like copper-binding protein
VSSDDQPDPTPATQGPSERGNNPYSTLLTILGAGVALALVILAIGFVTDDDGDGGGGDEAGSGDTAQVTLTEFAIDGSLTVPPGATLEVTNEGTQIHNLYIDGDGNTADLNGGDSEQLSTEGLAAGKYVVYCNISGHREAGMESILNIEEGASIEAAGGESHGGADPDWQKLDEDMLATFRPFVDAITTGEPVTEGKGGQLLEPVIDPDGYKRFDLTAERVQWEVEAGKTVDAWTYNGTVPGPTIRADVGDKIRIRLTNKLPLGTDLHPHGAGVPNEFDGVAPLTQDLILPGETMDYEFTADSPRVAMYHPHAHGYLLIPDGMWGAIIIGDEELVPRGTTVSGVDIPADLTLAKNDIMVLNDAGSIGLSLNGKSFPATEGYEMKQGEWAMFHYYNEGLQIHPMHLHQFPQLVVARDGIPLDQPYFVDTLMVAPGERYSVLFQATSPGLWVWHCHILTHAERDAGMFGMVTAVAVE